MAMEQLNATKGQIGTQIGTAMLGTLNAAPQRYPFLISITFKISNWVFPRRISSGGIL